MLVLSRRRHEAIRVGNNITVTVLRLRGNCVRIGIEAPRETPITRGELRRSCQRAGATEEALCSTDASPSHETQEV